MDKTKDPARKRSFNPDDDVSKLLHILETQYKGLEFKHVVNVCLRAGLKSLAGKRIQLTGDTTLFFDRA